MGDPRKRRKKYSTPSHPWQKERIELERMLKKEYGLKNKKEIWKIESLLRRYKKIGKETIIAETDQAKRKKSQLIMKLQSYGLVGESAQLDDVLSLASKDLFERRLQTLVFKKKLARTIKQARQLIVHGHIMVGKRKVTVPGYLVKKSEEEHIVFSPSSSFASVDHPERVKE
ncbi:MAG: 30S ribosomal protein S4 [Candidatus Woesearchaeota archaeon]